MFHIDLLMSQRRKTPEGYLIVPARIARAGIQEYAAHELGLTDGDPNRTIRVYRPPEEVFAPAAMASFESKPITDDHPDEHVTAHNWREHAVGFACHVRRDNEWLIEDLIVTDAKTIEKVEAGKEELSGGYDADLKWGAGVTPQGEPFDCQQIDIRGNHVAIVDAGRCGPSCRISDCGCASSITKGDKPMAKRRITVDGINLDLEETEASAVESIAKKLQGQIGQLEQDLEAATAPIDVAGEPMTKEQLVARIAELTKQLAELEARAAQDEDPEARDAELAEMNKQIGDARRLVPSIVTDGKPCSAIRREVVASMFDGYRPMLEAILGGKAPSEAPAPLIDTAFRVLAAAPIRDSASTASDDVVTRALADHAQNMADSDDPRAAYIKQLTNACKGS